MKSYFQLFLVAILIVGCGSSGDDEKDSTDSGSTGKPNNTDPVSGSSSFKIVGAVDERDNGDFSQTSGNRCDKDLNTGLFHLKFLSGADVLEVRVKNLRSTPKNYSCSQASNNSGKDNKDLGDFYNTCMVGVRAEAEDAGGYSGYDIYRSDEQMAAFSYAGDCMVKIIDVGNVVEGSVDCRGMIQTYRDGSLRNPINSGVVADVSGEFSCDLRKQ